MTTTKIIRHGTVFMTNTTKNIRSKGPMTNYQIPLIPTRKYETISEDGIAGNDPSVSLIQSVEDDKTPLFLWQLQQVKTMGLAGFRQWSIERMGYGSTLHATVASMLRTSAETGSLPSRELVLKTVREPVVGYVRSIYPFLSSLTPDPLSQCIEQNVSHPELMYKGRFDAVIRYKNSLYMFDWKTASKLSAVSKNLVTKPDDLSRMYGYPRQIAAYIGAYNADPRYKDREQITKGAVVLIYDSGEEAEVVEIGEDKLERAWPEWLDQVKSFWNRIESSESSTVDVVFRAEDMNKKKISVYEK